MKRVDALVQLSSGCRRSGKTLPRGAAPLIGLFAAAFALAGCGGSGGGSAPPPPPPPPPPLYDLTAMKLAVVSWYAGTYSTACTSNKIPTTGQVVIRNDGTLSATKLIPPSINVTQRNYHVEHFDSSRGRGLTSKANPVDTGPRLDAPIKGLTGYESDGAGISGSILFVTDSLGCDPTPSPKIMPRPDVPGLVAPYLTNLPAMVNCSRLQKDGTFVDKVSLPLAFSGGVLTLGDRTFKLADRVSENLTITAEREDPSLENKLEYDYGATFSDGSTVGFGRDEKGLRFDIGSTAPNALTYSCGPQ